MRHSWSRIPRFVLVLALTIGTVQAVPLGAWQAGQTATAPQARQQRRMIVLLFDISQQPEDLRRGTAMALAWVSDSMTVSDMIAVATTGSRLNVVKDFTSSREELIAALQSPDLSTGTAPDLATLAKPTNEPANTSAVPTVRLRALTTLCETIAPIQQKKALFYFGSGISRPADVVQGELRTAAETCSRANVTIYPVDARGIQAVIAPNGRGLPVMVTRSGVE